MGLERMAPRTQRGHRRTALRAARWLAVTGAIVAATAARGQGPVPRFAASASSGALQRYAEGSHVPEGYDRPAIERLLTSPPLTATEEQVEVPQLLVVKPWKASPALSVAALDTSTYGKASFGAGAEEKASALRLVVFEAGTAGEAPAPKARGVFEGPAERRLHDLDLAAYRLAPGTVALGVRSETHFAYGGGGGRNEYLTLYVAEGEALREVWTTRMVSAKEVGGDWNADGSRDKPQSGDERSATITVLPGTTRGLHDLRKSIGRRSAIYRWNGTTYVAQARDPVPDVNGEE